MKGIHYNIVPQVKYNVKLKYNNFIPTPYTNIIFTSLVPKFLNKFVGKNRHEFWSKYFNSLNPNKSLGYKSDIDYLKLHNLSKKQVVENSIKQIYGNIESEDFKLLSKYICSLISNEKIAVVRETKTAVYREVINIFDYIKQIKKLLIEYPLQKSEHHGTAHSTKSKALIKTQINKLEDRLNHPYFPIKDEEEIKYTKYLLKLLNYSLDDKYKNLPEYFNFLNMSFGLDSKIIDLEPQKLEYLKSFLNFYNGIKTERIALVQSVAIYINITLNKLNLDSKEKAELILNIVEMFFVDEIINYNRKKNSKKKSKKRMFTFNAKDIEKGSRIKTVFYNTLIYSYNYKGANDFVMELFQNGLNALYGIQNIFEPEKPIEEDISNFTSLLSIAKFKKESGFTKKDLKIIQFFLERDTNSNVGENLPSS